MRFSCLRALASDAVSRIGSAVAASAKRKAHLDLDKQNAKENIRQRSSKPRKSRSAFSDEDFSPHDTASLSNGRADLRLNARRSFDECAFRGQTPCVETSKRYSILSRRLPTRKFGQHRCSSYGKSAVTTSPRKPTRPYFFRPSMRSR